MTTPDDIDNAIEDQEAAKRKAAEERNLRLSKMMSDRIGLDIIAMLQQKHPGMHPAIVSGALIGCLSSIITLFAGSDMAKALEGSDVTQRQLRATVMGMMANRNKPPVPPAQTIITPNAAPN
jgi:hypothetical protein